MFANYLKIAVRVFSKNKAYSLINLAGMALGLTCCLLITLYVRDELSHESSHEKADQIYRVIAESGREEDKIFDSANTSFPVGSALKEAFPEVLDAIRFREGFQGVVSYGGQSFAEKKFFFTDPTVFEVFTFPFLSGNPETALSQPNNVVLTARAAKKYFGEDNPVGKIIHYEGWAGPADLIVTGVLEDLPHNTHFDFEFLASLEIVANEEFPWTWFTSLWTYVLLPENYHPEALKQKFPEFVTSRVQPHLESEESWFMLDLEPLRDIHLYSGLDTQMKPVSSIQYVYLFSAIAVIILALACINFTNLSTARALKRAKEVGMRKTLGGRRQALILQFFSESLFFCLLALAFAITLTELVLPYFNQLAGKAVRINYFEDGFIFLALAGILIFTGILAGSYPALVISRFSPIAAFKGGSPSGVLTKSRLRKGLVIFQFATSIFLLIAAIVISGQLEYVRSKNLGANIEQVVVAPVSKNADLLIHELKQKPGVLNASASSRIPANLESFDTRPVFVEGFQEAVEMENFNIDEDFLATFEIELVAGRNLSRERVGDSTAFLINESAVREFGWGTPEDALGKQIGWQFNYKKGRVIGVVKDFHMASFRESIQPLILHKMKESFWYTFLSARLDADNLSTTLQTIEETWREFNPNGGYEYFFADNSFAKIHRADARFGEIVTVFTFMAAVISCLGLLGLISYAVEQRTKEIGVRKILGATTVSVAALLSKDVVRLVLLANLIAWPSAWLAMNEWLQDFAYRIDISWQVFAAAGGLALAIALLTVSAQAIRAALANPVESLRYD